LTRPVCGSGRLCRRWPIAGALGSISCKAAYIARDVSKLASVYTLVALSVDRCLASYPTLGHLRTYAVGKVVCIVVWTTSALLASPYGFLARADRCDSLSDNNEYVYSPMKAAYIHIDIKVYNNIIYNVPIFSANMRKLVYSLYCSLQKSDNVLVQTALNCDMCTVSPLFNRWRNLLF